MEKKMFYGQHIHTKFSYCPSDSEDSLLSDSDTDPFDTTYVPADDVGLNDCCDSDADFPNEQEEHFSTIDIQDIQPCTSNQSTVQSKSKNKPECRCIYPSWKHKNLNIPSENFNFTGNALLSEEIINLDSPYKFFFHIYLHLR